MSRKMVNGSSSSSSSSRKPGMDWDILNRLKGNAAKGAVSPSLPALPNPEALLHYMDTAIASAEYSQASHHLSVLLSDSSPRITSSSRPSADPDSSSRHSALTVPLFAPVSQTSDSLESQPQKQPKQLNAPVAKTTSSPKSLPVSRFCPIKQEISAKSQSRLSTKLEPSNHASFVDPSDALHSNRLRLQEHDQRQITGMKATGLNSRNQSLLIEELNSGCLDLRKSPGEVSSTEFEIGKNSDELRVEDRDPQEPGNWSQSQNLKTLSGSLGSKPKDQITRAQDSAGSNIYKEHKPLQCIVLNSEVEKNGTEVYDAQAADEAYRAGCSALSEGQMELAMSLLQIASSKCPPEKHFALAKLQRLIANTAQLLEKQETATGSRKAESGAHS